MDKLGPYDLNTIITGDARELAEAIPDESVDLIFTDPVYQNIDDYRWLAETAVNILKPEGSVLVFQWSGFMRETLNALQPLKLEWIFSLYIPNRTIDTRCKAGFNKWTPCLWMSMGEAKSPRVADILQCNAFQAVFNNGSSNHEWSKSPEFFYYYLEAFTQPDSIVFDPFTGGGTVPAVCKMLGRNYLAFEIDPPTAARARERVAMTQPPLFVVQPEQIELAL